MPNSVEGLFRRLFQSGQLQGFPKNPGQRDTVLAVAATALTRRRPYPEWEINEALAGWLASVRADIDHVTLRRRMVDLGFLKRRADGSVYFLNYGRVVEVLGDPAVEVDAGSILDDILRERGARRRAYVKDTVG
ncbi:MAG: DUF2087 domain-containing protein [Gammaproteobacteria bacterium]|nr:DUF2087 domain-containing protein [Gammaproteobacteria bacterium]MDE0225631.1 DUF2087 domain-containing protein [Gammaproteobacteria bacterium]